MCLADLSIMECFQLFCPASNLQLRLPFKHLLLTVSIDQIASFFQLQPESLFVVDVSRDNTLCIPENGAYVFREVAEGSMFQVTGTMFEHSPGYVGHTIFSKGSNIPGCDRQREIGRSEFLGPRMSQGQSIGPSTTSLKDCRTSSEPHKERGPQLFTIVELSDDEDCPLSQCNPVVNLDNVFLETQKNSSTSLEKSYPRHDLVDDVKDKVFLSNNPTVECTSPIFTSQCVPTPLKGDRTSIPQSSISRLDMLPQGSNSIKSVLDILHDMKIKGSRIEFLQRDLKSMILTRVLKVPTFYKGDVIFELPPISTPNVSTGGLLEGLANDSDVYPWTKPSSHTIADAGELRLKSRKCMGHCICKNISCPHLAVEGRHNETNWTGMADSLTAVKEVCKPPFRCAQCKIPPTCVALCSARFFLVFSKSPTITRVGIHLGVHEHLVLKGDGYCGSVERGAGISYFNI
jgi:hypothetical protein